jgi:hypothetical protein
MATKDVRFAAFKVVKKPTKVTFKSKTGKPVSFKP